MELTYVNGKVETAPSKSSGRYGLLLADVQAIRVLWPTIIRPGLLQVKRKDKRSGYWTPEHVRAAIDSGHAGRLFCECHLIIPVASDKPCGFVVLRLYNDEFIQVPTALFAWITCCNDPKAMKYVLPLLEKRAREIGVNCVKGVTSRTAWARRLRRFGYNVDQIIISKELD